MFLGRTGIPKIPPPLPSARHFSLMPSSAAVDRTAEFRGCAHYTAAPVVASESCRSSPYNAQAALALSSLSTLNSELSLAERNGFSDPKRTLPASHQSMETALRDIARLCASQIDALREGLPDPSSQKIPPKKAHLLAHRHGVALALSERLAKAMRTLDSMSQKRDDAEKAAEAAFARRRRYSGAAAPSQSSLGQERQQQQQMQYTEAHGQQQQQQMQHAEAHAVLADLRAFEAQARLTESQVEDIARLNHELGQHVVHQTAQIEQLYMDAVDTADNVARGNVELKKAVERSGTAAWIVFVILVCLSFALLVLDYVSG